MESVIATPQLMSERLYPQVYEARGETLEAVGTLYQEMESGNYDDRLAGVGLGPGPGLDLKLAGFYFTLEDYLAAGGQGFPGNLPPGPDLGPLKRLLLKVLKWANRLLGSICAAVPIDAAELLKEGKEAIEGAIEDALPVEP